MIPKKTLFFCAAAVILNWAGAYLLNSLGLVEHMLSPHGNTLVWILPLSVLFYLVRFLAYFLVPGLLLGTFLVYTIEKRRAQLPPG
ncbi:MAG: hypothetical protein IPK82_26145 [Polyangiaceae bacterium]|nr:hypothetical protein [Polyangiaceae bacterium]